MDTSRGERETGTGESAEDPRDQVSAEPDDAPEPGGTWEAADASAYWRRRFFILCGGVAALGLMRGCSPARHQAGQPSAAARASMAAAATRQALPAAATGQAWAPSPSAPPARRPEASRAAPRRADADAAEDQPRLPAAGGVRVRRVRRAVLLPDRAQPVHQPAQLQRGRTARVQGLRRVHREGQLHAALRRGGGPGRRHPAGPGGVELGRVQARGGQAGDVHPGGPAGAGPDLEPRRGRARGLRRVAARRQPPPPSARWC